MAISNPLDTKERHREGDQAPMRGSRGEEAGLQPRAHVQAE